MADYVGYDDMGEDDGDTEDMSGEEYVGYDDMGATDDEILGAVRRPPPRRLPPGRMPPRFPSPRPPSRPAPRAARPPQLVGTARDPKKLRGYLGMGSVLFTSTSGTQLSVTVEPQRGFRPERLIIDRRDGSVVTNGISARVVNIFIGDQPQSPSVEQPAPTEMFARDATVSGIDFDKAIPGQKITIQYSVTAAPAGTELILLSAGFYGDMLR